MRNRIHVGLNVVLHESELRLNIREGLLAFQWKHEHDPVNSLPEGDWKTGEFADVWVIEWFTALVFKDEFESGLFDGKEDSLLSF